MRTRPSLPSSIRIVSNPSHSLSDKHEKEKEEGGNAFRPLPVPERKKKGRARVNSEEGKNLVMREILGSKMWLRTDDPGISADLLKKGVREPAVTEILHREIRPGDAVIDIGANIGYYALLEARLVGSEGTVYAIEPVPENYELLCKNIELNGYTNIKPYLLAIGDRNGTETLHLTKQSNCGVILGDIPRSARFKRRMEAIGTGATIDVEIISLDEFVEREGIDPDFIRMDVEGYEIAIIEGMKKILSESRNLRIEMELHYGHYGDPKVITQALQKIFAAGFYQKYFVVNLGNRIVTDAHVLHAPHYRAAPHVLLEKRPVNVLAVMPRIGYRSGANRALAVLMNELSKREDIAAKIKVDRSGEGWTDLNDVEIRAPESYPEEREIYDWADVIITQSRYLRTVRECAPYKPIAYYAHNDYRIGRSSNVYNDGVNEENVDLMIFNANWVKDRTPWEGGSLVVHPPVFPDRFRTETTREYITQVNLNKFKGGDIFFELARRLPDKCFLGVKGWGPQVPPPKPLPDNVTVIPSTKNIRDDVYAKTRILLVPSQYVGDTEEFVWTESWGMVAIEAMASGIPVIASPTPGLLESLGTAGIFVEREDIDGWEKAIRMLDDPEVYAHHSRLAAERAAELDPAPQIEQLAEALRLLGLRYLQGFPPARALSVGPSWPSFGIVPSHYRILVKNIGDRLRERAGYIFYPGVAVIACVNAMRLAQIKACEDLQVIQLEDLAGRFSGRGDSEP